MPTRLRKFGNEGENIAVEYLEKKGYKIIARNWQYKKVGEIDIIALAPKSAFWRREQRRFVFVEVKTRKTDTYGAPELAVHRSKQEKFVRTVLIYLQMHRLESWPHQCDVIAITFHPITGTPHILHLENAMEGR
ncbi:YraN family protein [Candidatus Uhrbacteria bacterium]|nr:YraN family protein [Candidatus Uhrbacteria bacterium]